MPDRTVSKVVIHSSLSSWGSFAAIEKWHARRGWGFEQDGQRHVCGYHFIIGNGFTSYGGTYDPAADGLVEAGRPLDLPGGVVSRAGWDLIEICLVGNPSALVDAAFRDIYTEKQEKALYRLLSEILYKYDTLEIVGDCHLRATHPACPGFDIYAIDWDSNVR